MVKTTALSTLNQKQKKQQISLFPELRSFFVFLTKKKQDTHGSTPPSRIPSSSVKNQISTLRVTRSEASFNFEGSTAGAARRRVLHIMAFLGIWQKLDRDEVKAQLATWQNTE